VPSTTARRRWTAPVDLEEHHERRGAACSAEIVGDPSRSPLSGASNRREGAEESGVPSGDVVHHELVSDDFIRLIPMDAAWQPPRLSADAATSYVSDLFAGSGRSVDEVTSEYFDTVTLIDAGVNTSKAKCHLCNQSIDLDWVFEVINELDASLANLDVVSPCCGAVVSLNDLDYDWPMGFARFEITVMNGSRPKYELDAEELGQVALLLGHPVRQVLAHY